MRGTERSGRKKGKRKEEAEKEGREDAANFFPKEKFFTVGDRLQKTAIAFNEMRKVIIKLLKKE